ncbi:MAG: hypothetical protein NTW21_41145 [Verrucomicrobia bacterium]|nr:hypothetical protein [Verrucomicrobiota bacterium]
MIACLLSRDIIPFATIVISFILGLWSASFLDRRRALNAVRGRIQIALDEIDDKGLDPDERHRLSIVALKEPLLSTLPLLTTAKQKRVKDVWNHYRKLSLAEYVADTQMLVLALSKSLGLEIKTKGEAIHEALRDLDAALK